MLRKIESAEKGLKTVHKQWALYSIKRLRLIHPNLSLVLYGDNWHFTIHVENCEADDFAELDSYFHNSVRPVTCSITLSQRIPQDIASIDETSNYEAELWLNGEPLSTPAFNALLALAEPALPAGGIDFDSHRDTWIFRSFGLLTDDEKTCVQRAAAKAGIAGPIDFIVTNPPTTKQGSVSTSEPRDKLDLKIGRYFNGASSVVRDLLHEDEDDWRTFLSHRAKQAIVAPDQSTSFACLYDVENCGESRLSELLTLYDRVELMPARRSLEWSSKHQISIPDLQELVRLKRIRMILPYSVSEYPSELIEAVAEVDRSSIVLSRNLATKTIARGQMKEPFLYAPLSYAQRAALLSTLSQTVTNDTYRKLLSIYGRMSSSQHDLFMMRGALASLSFGVGAYLGEIFFELKNKDARMELSACGAGIEWALGLGAGYIPRDFGGFDETRNSQIVASYLGRTSFRSADPVANRMHIISDGLLAVSDVPPLEVARNFHSLSISRFRKVAQGLMQATTDTSELRHAVNQINADVKSFDRRLERLSSWRVHALLKAAGMVAIEEQHGICASVVAAWLYEVLENKLPTRVRNELADATAMLAGLATGSPIDAIVVSRSRKAITMKDKAKDT